MEILPQTESDGQAVSKDSVLLRGSLPDQAALFGLLARVRDLNLTLLEVKRLDDERNNS